MELLHEAFSFSFGETFLNNAGSAVNEFLSLFEAETCEFLNELNDSELACTGSLKYNVKVSFFLSGRSTGCGTGCYCNGCCGGFDAVFILKDSGEFVYFLYGKVYKLFCKCF